MILTRRDVVDLDADVSQLLSAAVDSPRIPLSPHAQGKFSVIMVVTSLLNLSTRAQSRDSGDSQCFTNL